MPGPDSHTPSGTADPSHLILVSGPNRFLHALPIAVTIAATIAILLSTTGWAWKVPVLAALGLSAVAVRHVSNRAACSGTLSLSANGFARLSTSSGLVVNARLLDNAWSSPWLSVVALFEPDCSRHYYCVVCASENLSGEYRRLLKLLHMRAPSAEKHNFNGS